MAVVSEKERRLMIAEEKLQDAKNEIDLFIERQLIRTKKVGDDAKIDRCLQYQLREAEKEYKAAKDALEAYSDDEIDMIADMMCGISQEKELTIEEEKILDNIANLY